MRSKQPQHPNAYGRYKLVSEYQIAVIATIFLVILFALRASQRLGYLDESFSSRPDTITNQPPAQPRYYTKCGPSAKRHNPATAAALQRLNIQYAADPATAILFLPCGYNYLESELAALNPAHPQQVIFAVKGADQLCSKNQLWHRLQYRWGRQRARQLTPETWAVSNSQDRAALHGLPIDDLTNGVFILKKNIQRKRGLQMVRGMIAVDQALQEDSTWRVVQRYIKYPLCINNRKLNLRMYICIVCPGDGSRPEWWLHQAGKCIYTASRYDPDQSTATTTALQDRRQHFTSFDLDPNTTYGHTSNGLPESFEELAQHPDMGSSRWHALWLDIVNAVSGVRQAYQKEKIKEASAPKPQLCFIDSALAGHRCFQLFGMDVIVDTNPTSEYHDNEANLMDKTTSRYRNRRDTQQWQPLILEFNKGPEMSFKSPKDSIMKPQVMTDCLRLGLDKDTNGWQAIP